ncbi:MAG: long-chain fatty acid transporter [Bacteroidetes bacterium 46-16]|nr:MAG: long-chain fatty acid transporter [Bacteroidetes bacterium 46-16]
MRYIIIIIFFAFIGEVHAENRISDYNNIGWYTTNITPRISKRFSGHLEYQWRRNNWVTEWQQSLLRAGVNYKLHKQLTVHLGYGWILTYPYGDYTASAVAKTFPEHRAYAQLQISTPIEKVSFQHRFRIEQRWVGKYKSITSDSPDEWVSLQRVRYMPRVDVPLHTKVYAAAFDEIFIGFGKNVGENIFDQNRIGALLGYKFHPVFRAEAGYINQTVQLGREINNSNVFQYNHGLVVNTYLQLD